VRGREQSFMQMFAVHRRFGPSSCESWTDYINWSGLTHILELVTADSLLCPNIIERPIDEDWKYNIHADCRTCFFHDFEYLRRRAGYDANRHNLLCIEIEPNLPVALPKGFEFCGYDILDSDESISVLTNCGGFPEVFHGAELDKYGLIKDLSRANEIAEAIRTRYPEDPHCCECRVWSLSRYVESRPDNSH
jgi:hypothetical protein